jgi:hypothetical protein
VKIIKVEITRCNQCPHWSMGVCTKEGQPIGGMHYPPDWCPLEDAPDTGEECWTKEDRCNDCPANFPLKSCPDYEKKPAPPEEG